MAGELKNISSLFKNTRTRAILIVTIGLFILAVVTGILALKKRIPGPPAEITLREAPTEIKSIPGGFEQAQTAEYAKLQTQQNIQQAQAAKKGGGSAIPTIISANPVTGGWQGAALSTINQPQGAGAVPGGYLLRAGGRPAGSEGTPIYNAQGQITGLAYEKENNQFCVVNCTTTGTLGPDGLIRDAKGNVIGKVAASALGTPVYDPQGRLVGYAGADGKVRDLKGNVVGSIGPNGAFRNAAGKPGGASLGVPIYDSNGRLIGYASPDGTVRGLNGNPIGKLGADGTVRDKNGKVIGSTAGGAAAATTPVYDTTGRLVGYADPNGTIRDANGKLVGALSPDGTIRDTTGKIIGTAAPGPRGAAGVTGAAVGPPVYDSTGRLVGYAGPNGTIRDATGKVVGTLAPDGTLRDVNGRVIGSVGPQGVAGAAGTPVYDTAGRLVGYADPNGTIRDTTGKVVGSLSPDGTIRDTAGKIIGTAAPGTKGVVGAAAGAGTPVYDSTGRLVGYADPNGTIRDATGKVVGSLSPDGTIRDTTGKVVGTAGPGPKGAAGAAGAAAAPLAALAPAGAAAVGGAGAAALPAAGVPPAAAPTEAEQLQAVRQRQQQQLEQQQAQQNQQQLASAMTAQQNLLFTAWAGQIQQQYVQGEEEKTKEGTQKGTEKVIAKGSSGGEVAASVPGPGSFPFVKAGTVLYAILNTAVNSDEPGPVMATIVGNKFRGAKLLGTLVNEGQKVMLTFNVMSIAAVPSSISVNAIAIDPVTARTALSSHTNNHYLLRYGSLFASAFMQGIGQAVQESGATVVSNGLNTVTTMPRLNTEAKLVAALGTVGQNWSEAVRPLFNKPPTVQVYSGTCLGILFLADVAPPT